VSAVVGEPRKFGLLGVGTLPMLAMFIAVALSVVLTPTRMIAGGRALEPLETLIPLEFGEWAIDPVASAIVVANPQQTTVLEKIYADTLSRTYVNKRGERIMLSVAYGSDQSDSMQVHKPEVCYPAQGFAISYVRRGILEVADFDIPVSRLKAVQGSRRELVTYWIRVGDRAVNAGVAQKVAQLGYGLAGYVPDGLLFRVSSIGSDDEAEFKLHAAFAGELLANVSEDHRVRLVGANGVR
jgi:EpsI family protein